MYTMRYDKNTMKQEFTTHSSEETTQLGERLAQDFRAGILVTLKGDLGAGKTSMTQGILARFGAEKPYTSPTFVIMKQYDIHNDTHPTVRRIYHVDAYRVDAEKLLSIGWDEWVHDEHGLVIVEWPERIQEILPENRMNISLQWLDENQRLIQVG